MTRDRENLAATARAGEAVLAEALDRLDEAQAEIAVLRASLARAEGRLDGRRRGWSGPGRRSSGTG